ncbi:hypothetical protein ONZ45_g13745 [Pleurotus djamor]|nr:hypothetical protein ONZ45_g13745 [Pleurotus djamor]
MPSTHYVREKYRPHGPHISQLQTRGISPVSDGTCVDNGFLPPSSQRTPNESELALAQARFKALLKALDDYSYPPLTSSVMREWLHCDPTSLASTIWFVGISEDCRTSRWINFITSLTSDCRRYSSAAGFKDALRDMATRKSADMWSIRGETLRQVSITSDSLDVIKLATNLIRSCRLTGLLFRTKILDISQFLRFVESMLPLNRLSHVDLLIDSERVLGLYEFFVAAGDSLCGLRTSDLLALRENLDRPFRLRNSWLPRSFPRVEDVMELYHVLQTFTTLSNYPHLAKYVQSLEIRDFPKSQHEGQSTIFPRGLRNCINLRYCVWTRDGSLNDEIIRNLSELKQLQSLTINGHSTSEYNESLLLQIRGLHDVSLIMPSLDVVDILSDWAAVSDLRSLELICKSSSYVTNDKLDTLASACPNLERLRLIGCVKVTHVGLYKILSSNRNGLTDLGLEGLSPNFDIHQFAIRACGHLKRLKAITLTIDKEEKFGNWTASVAALLQQAPLQQLQIYSTGTRPRDTSDDEHWMLLSLDVIDNICRRCVALEQLFVTIQQSDLAWHYRRL